MNPRQWLSLCSLRIKVEEAMFHAKIIFYSRIILISAALHFTAFLLFFLLKDNKPYSRNIEKNNHNLLRNLLKLLFAPKIFSKNLTLSYYNKTMRLNISMLFHIP